MKKMIAMLIAVVLSLTLFAYAEVRSIEYTADDTYAAADLGGCATAAIPSDWTSVNVEYDDETGDLIGSFINADGTEMLLITRTTLDAESDCDSLYAEAVEAGLDAEQLDVNGNVYAAITAGNEEQFVLMAMTFEDPSTLVTFTFSADTEAEIEDIIAQVLGSYAA